MAEEKSPAPPSVGPPKTFTGVKRERKTRRSILLMDKASKWIITIGGLGTILSVLGVAVFLMYVVLPLFLPAKVDDLHAVDEMSDELVHIALDEYQLLTWTLDRDGQIVVTRLDSGEARWTHQLFEPGEMLSSSFLVSSDVAAFGLADGSVQLMDIGFSTQILDAPDLDPAVLSKLEAGDPLVNMGNGVIEPTPAGQFRFQELQVEDGPRSRVSEGPVEKVDHVVSASGPFVLALVRGGEPGPELDADAEAADGANAAAEGETDPGSELTATSAEASEPAAGAQVAAVQADPLRLLALSWEEETNFLTGESSLSLLDPAPLPFDAETAPDFMEVSGAGVEAYLVWKDGHMVRLYIRDLSEPLVAERGSLLAPGSERELRFFEPILGGTTFLWGDSAGDINGGFTVRTEDAVEEVRSLYDLEQTGADPRTFARTKELASESAAATASSPSARSRMALAGFADGHIELYNVTNASRLLYTSLPDKEPVVRLLMAPKEDGILVATTKNLWHGRLDPRYPEASVAAFFKPVWYEGYAEPRHIWQSSSATDDFEMKLGLMPLVFGTLKATFYSMLFGVPLALLAELFTSEFLHPRAKNVIKPAIELMASLPSVVLGFLAALVFAPYIEKVVPGTLSLIVTLPVTLLLGAYLWQLLPGEKAIRWQNWRFLFMALLIPVGVLMAGAVGPLVEKWLFAGDIKGWLAWVPGGDEQFANPIGGWMLLFIPISAFTIAMVNGRYAGPFMRGRGSQWDRRQYATVDLVKFFAALASTVLLALALSALMASLGFDPRGSYVDTYVQRNAMIVGFVMGFAIIPIIYTISEDALSTVPEHLRSASLGAGATPWQTATRIIIPTAMSGLFSAMMVGLGRAVGETMIVLMAAGNTPVMEWNIFEGFRTLSANIAVELPEAVRGDTHYRTLFLAALVLFMMTFVVNTIAEGIRQRFRKRAYQL
ncbi:MAG: ABC transporter permease subunit [Acidobacteriota bacterium]